MYLDIAELHIFKRLYWLLLASYSVHYYVEVTNLATFIALLDEWLKIHVCYVHVMQNTPERERGPKNMYMEGKFMMIFKIVRNCDC